MHKHVHEKFNFETWYSSVCTGTSAASSIWSMGKRAVIWNWKLHWTNKGELNFPKSSSHTLTVLSARSSFYCSFLVFFLVTTSTILWQTERDTISLPTRVKLYDKIGKTFSHLECSHKLLLSLNNMLRTNLPPNERDCEYFRVENKYQHNSF